MSLIFFLKIMKKYRCKICGHIAESETHPIYDCPVCFCGPEEYEEIVEE